MTFELGPSDDCVSLRHEGREWRPGGDGCGRRQGAGSAGCAQGAVSGWRDCGTWCHEAVPADRRSQLVQGLRAWPLPSLSLPYRQKADGIDS